MSEGRDKQAGVVIHGIGEQRPMTTLRGFVDAVWSGDDTLRGEYAANTVWSKPDTISGSYELRQLTTGYHKRGRRTDFFELYWAHRVHGTTWSHVLAWPRTLLLRQAWTLAPQLRLAWALLVVLGLAVGLFAIEAAPVMKNVVGDAARYLVAAPRNVKRRQEIRSHAVEILAKLHEAGYERIVGGESQPGCGDRLRGAHPRLGPLQRPPGPRCTQEPAQQASRPGRPGGPRADGAGRRLPRPRRLADSQRGYRDELRSIGCPRRVTDLVTLGNPLTHAEVLLAKDREDLAQRQAARELPTCPPALDGQKFSYPSDHRNRIPDHGAVFGPTRWTNLYFPSHLIFHGDFIGGPVAPVLGPRVKDVAVTTK